MDFVRPVQALIPGAQGRILAVLAETTADLNLRTLARLAGVSNAQATRVLPALVELGIIDRREAPPSALFRLVPEHVASRAISAMASARRTVLGELGRAAGELDPQPVSVVVFGSFARGDADRESDLDLVIVRPAEFSEDKEGWHQAVDGLRKQARRLTGNRVEVIEIGVSEARRLLRSRKSLWLDVQRDGVAVFGTGLAELQGRRSA